MTEQKQKDSIEEVRSFLCGYQLCMDMLALRRYERKRHRPFDDEFDCSELLAADETYWRARMYEVKMLIDRMHNGREKLVLYYHYIKGERIERIADFLGFSRRTAYRAHTKGLLQISYLYQRAKQEGLIFEASEE